MVEIIRRKAIGEKETFNSYDGFKIQASYNSYGHVTLRFYNPEKADDSEILIVLDSSESYNLITFLKRIMQ